jgi:rubredoxin
MTKCLNCGYERQPKDEGIIPPTECPKCGIIYDKATPPGNKEAHPGSSFPDSEKTPKENLRTGKLLAYIFLALVIIVVVPVGIKQYPAIIKIISGGWYNNTRGLEEAYKEQKSTGKPILVFFMMPS